MAGLTATKAIQDFMSIPGYNPEMEYRKVSLVEFKELSSEERQELGTLAAVAQGKVLGQE